MDLIYIPTCGVKMATAPKFSDIYKIMDKFGHCLLEDIMRTDFLKTFLRKGYVWWWNHLTDWKKKFRKTISSSTVQKTDFVHNFNRFSSNSNCTGMLFFRVILSIVLSHSLNCKENWITLLFSVYEDIIRIWKTYRKVSTLLLKS